MSGVGAGSLTKRLGKAVGLLLPYGAVVVMRGLDGLYMLQLERYKPDRYRAWVRTHRALLVRTTTRSPSLTSAGATSTPAGRPFWVMTIGSGDSARRFRIVAA